MTLAPSDTTGWQQLDTAHHVHPFCDPATLAERGVTVITHADGSYIWDSDGNRILDAMAGLWCVNIGYGRKELARVAAEQMETLPYYNSFFQSSTPTQIALAERLSEVTPKGIEHFFFANSGSEANDTIIRLTRHYWAQQGKPKKRTFIGRNLAYHGSTLAASSLGGMSAMKAMDGEVLPDFAQIMEPHWFMRGGNMSREEFGIHAAQALEDKILEIGAENVAAFIGEPVQGAGGVIDPPANYWPNIQRICRKHDILLVVDEVICGFGRLGEWFGSDFYGVEPDIITMAKGLSSGYLPIAAVGFSKKVFAGINDGGVIQHGYTYSGHPVSCAVALANIDIIENEGLIEQVRDESAPYFHEVMQQLSDDHPIVGEWRGAGLLGAMHLMKNPQSREFFAPEDDPAGKCREYCLDHGLIMRAVGQAMILCPPLTISRSEIDEIAEKATIGLNETAKQLGLL